jgi:tetratricopeptide (TPR) repeat protein
MKTKILILLPMIFLFIPLIATVAADEREDLQKTESEIEYRQRIDNIIKRQQEVQSRYHAGLEKIGQWKQTRNQSLLTEAIEDFSYAIAEFDQERQKVGAYFKRGFCYGMLGDTDKCIEDFTRGLEIAPDNAYGRKTRGCQYMGQGKVREAREDFQFVCSKYQEPEACRWVEEIDEGNCKTVCHVQK